MVLNLYTPTKPISFVENDMCKKKLSVCYQRISVINLHFCILSKNMIFDFFLDFCQKHNQKHPGNAPKD